MTRHNALSALFGILGGILALSVVGSMQAQAATFSGASALSESPAVGGTFTGGIVPDETTFQDTVTFDVQMETDGIRLKANRDLKCATGNTCEIGSSGISFLRAFINQVDVAALRAKTAGAALDVAEPQGLIISHEEAAAPVQPHACTAAADFGLIHIVNDTDDGVVSTTCYCGQLSDDSTYDWLLVGADTACPFF